MAKSLSTGWFMAAFLDTSLCFWIVTVHRDARKRPRPELGRKGHPGLGQGRSALRLVSASEHADLRTLGLEPF